MLEGSKPHKGWKMLSSRKPRTIRDGDITIIEFGDDLTHLSEDVMPAVSKAVGEAGQNPGEKVLLDMTVVKYFGSSFIEVMYRLWKQVQSQKGKFAIAGLQPNCRDVLEVTNLDKLWTLTPDRESGLAALR